MRSPNEVLEIDVHTLDIREDHDGAYHARDASWA